jgi:hypothetical protein
MTGVFDHLSCVMLDEKISSAADFIGIRNIGLLTHPTPLDHQARIKNLTEQLKRQTIPIWFS